MNLVIRKSIQTDWHTRVYSKDEDLHPLPKNWDVLREAILIRDRHKCRVCHRKDFLSVHHKIPREDGGSDAPENLETLCDACHNLMELQYSEGTRVVNDKQANDSGDWHEWVYGGARNPKL